MDPKERAEDKRERLRQQELKNNPTGSLHDGLNRASPGGNLQDIAGGMGWKGMGLLIIALFVGYILYALFFR